VLYNLEPTGIQCPRKTFEECDGHTKSERVMTFYSAVNCKQQIKMMIALFYLVLLYTIWNSRQNKT
jgi:hypothetical protein